MNAFAQLDVADPGAVAPEALVRAVRAGLGDREHPVEVGSATEGDVLAAFAALVPEARRLHEDAGIPPEVTAATLVDVGSKHRIYGARTEVPWLLGILRGDVLSVGRLQVERRPGEDGRRGLHIPASGPLTADAVDASLRRASELLGATRFTCTSWLLEPVLVERLPGSNMAAFSRRFSLDPATTLPSGAGAASAAKFVFTASVDEVRDPTRLIPRTSLERLVADRLRSGAGWAEPTGVLSNE